GKSTVGPRLASRMGWKFVDLDLEIESAERRSIPEIFKQSGESNFRALETAAIKALDQRPNCVVALGGGAFAQEANRHLIHGRGVWVFLDCPLERILDRCPPDGTSRYSRLRPRLSGSMRHDCLSTWKATSALMSPAWDLMIL